MERVACGLWLKDRLAVGLLELSADTICPCTSDYHNRLCFPLMLQGEGAVRSTKP